MLDNAEILYEAIQLSEELEKRIERVFIYAHLINDFDLSEEKGNEYYGKAFKLYQAKILHTTYMTPELIEKEYNVV